VADNLEPGHNVVVYRGDIGAGPADVEIGVQISRAFEVASSTDVRCTELPSGRAAHVTHVGPYHQMRSAYDALNAWAAAGGHHLTGPSWEFYGDWTDDVSKLETDIYFLPAPE
jgi:effector-binding domain-containing protein